MIQPMMNGIVLPTVSFALGTLSAATITSLRQRQVTIRACLNKEACLIDLMLSVLETIFAGPARTTERRQAIGLLRAYTNRLMCESRRENDLHALEREGATESELRSLGRLLHRSPAIREGVFHEAGLAGYPTVTDGTVDALQHARQDSGAVLEPRFFVTTEFSSQAILKDLLTLRSERVALLTTTFPPSHWLTICLAGFSILVAFLVESDDQALLFLDRLQLRVMFALLVGALSGIGIILHDLNEPFRGPFRITPAITQLYDIRRTIDDSLSMDQSDDIVSSAR